MTEPPRYDIHTSHSRFSAELVTGRTKFAWQHFRKHCTCRQIQRNSTFWGTGWTNQLLWRHRVLKSVAPEPLGAPLGAQIHCYRATGRSRITQNCPLGSLSAAYAIEIAARAHVCSEPRSKSLSKLHGSETSDSVWLCSATLSTVNGHARVHSSIYIYIYIYTYTIYTT